MPRFVTVNNIPCWAASYFVNADTSGLTEEDIKLCKDYEKKLLRDSGCRLVCPIDDTRNEFCSWPAFGLGSDVEDYTAEIVPKSRVVIRKYWHPLDEKWVPVAFLPDEPSSDGWIKSLELGHSRLIAACENYYRSLKPCTDPKEYEPLVDKLFELGYRPRIVTRLVKRRKEHKA